MKKILVTALSAVILAGTGLFLCRANAGDPVTGRISMNTGPADGSVSSLSRTVSVEKVRVENSENRVSHPGTVQAFQTANLAFRVSGPLIQVNVKPGDRVKQGQVLMKIDPQDFRDRIGVLSAQLSGAESQLATARSDFNRMKTLFTQKVIPQADFDHARNAVNTAQAAVKGINAQLVIARHNLGYTELCAPYDAIITARMIENYEMVGQGRPVVSLHDISKLKIRINVPENEMAGHPLTAGTRARVRFPSAGNRSFPATLSEWNTSADPSTKTYQLTFVMPQPEQALVLPGMTAEMDWSSAGRKGSVITVPVKAVVTDGSDRSALWVLNRNTGTASLVPVTCGPFAGASRIVVEAGLTGEEWIVTQGMNFIVQGEKLSYTTVPE